MFIRQGKFILSIIVKLFGLAGFQVDGDIG